MPRLTPTDNALVAELVGTGVPKAEARCLLALWRAPRWATEVSAIAGVGRQEVSRIMRLWETRGHVVVTPVVSGPGRPRLQYALTRGQAATLAALTRWRRSALAEAQEALGALAERAEAATYAPLRGPSSRRRRNDGAGKKG